MPEDKGDLVRLTVTFTDTTGAPADPTAVRLYTSRRRAAC
jgi:hypothetical protein